MVLVDANILMYAAGAEHPNKGPCVNFLEQVAKGSVDAVLDAEVLQEILHRYRALGRWPDGKRLYDLARQLFPVVFPVDVVVLDAARHLLDLHPLTARDALHAAVVRVNSLDGICSYDRDFDQITGLRRLEP